MNFLIKLNKKYKTIYKKRKHKLYRNIALNLLDYKIVNERKLIKTNKINKYKKACRKKKRP